MKSLKFRKTDTDSAEPTPDETEASASDRDNVEATESDSLDHQPHTHQRRRIRWTRIVVYAMLPGIALLLALAAGFLKWQDASARDAQAAGTQSIRAATDATIALLSYKPDTVEKDLQSAKSQLTGTFLTSYTSLTRDVVIPGAKQKQISAEATVPAAASISANPGHAVVLLFVNQTVTIGHNAPTNTASSVRVTLDKISGRWLISQFDPV